jgi:hypothetical protein
MTDDDKITLTLAELRAVARTCYVCETRLATFGGSDSDFCDEHSETDDSVEFDDAPTIRAVQARIDGLSAQPAAERWAVRVTLALSGTPYVKGAGVFTYNEADANTWPNEAEALAWARLALPVGSYKVVRL